jgi:hypothetical protein
LDNTNGKVEFLAQLLDSKAKYDYNFNVLVHGVPESPNENNSNIKDNVCGIITKLMRPDQNISQKDMERIHRLGPVRKIFQGKTPNPRPIVAKFFHRDLKQSIVQSSYDRFKKEGNNVKGEPYITGHKPRELNKLFTNFLDTRESNAGRSGKNAGCDDQLEDGNNFEDDELEEDSMSELSTESPTLFSKSDGSKGGKSTKRSRKK